MAVDFERPAKRVRKELDRAVARHQSWKGPASHTRNQGFFKNIDF